MFPSELSEISTLWTPGPAMEASFHALSFLLSIQAPSSYPGPSVCFYTRPSVCHCPARSSPRFRPLCYQVLQASASISVLKFRYRSGQDLMAILSRFAAHSMSQPKTHLPFLCFLGACCPTAYILSPEILLRAAIILELCFSLYPTCPLLACFFSTSLRQPNQLSHVQHLHKRHVSQPPLQSRPLLNVQYQPAV